MQNYTVRGSAGRVGELDAEQPPGTGPGAPRGTLVGRTAGVERESDVVEFDDQGSTRCAVVRCSAVDGAQGKGASRVRSEIKVALRHVLLHDRPGLSMECGLRGIS